MPVVEKTSGGSVYLRDLDADVAVGDRVDVTERQADYLVSERGDFALVAADETAPADAGPPDETPAEEDGPPDDTVEAIDPGDLTVSELSDVVADIDDADRLRALRNAEAGGKDRTTAKDAIDDRLDDLEPEG